MCTISKIEEEGAQGPSNHFQKLDALLSLAICYAKDLRALLDFRFEKHAEHRKSFTEFILSVHPQFSFDICGDVCC